MRVIFVLCFVALATWLNVSSPALAQNRSDFTRLFDAYNGAAKTGDVKKMLSMRTMEQRESIKSQIKKGDEREAFVLIARAQAPESYEVQHVSATAHGLGTTLYVLAQYAAMPEIERPRCRAEESISFKKEKGEWRIDSILALADPDKIKRPKDLKFDYKEADTSVSSGLGGRIVKTEFFADHTLVILRVMDEDDAVFLPAREVLLKSGMPLEELDPWKLHEFTGYPHKTDKLKFFATGGKALEE